MSDWDKSDDDVAPHSAAPVAKKPAVVRSKWEGEDEEDSAPVSDWEASSEEEEEKPKPTVVAPPKKKGTLKAKLAEKAALKAEKQDEDDLEYDEDAVLDPREKARRDRERELNADLNNAAELLGAAALGGSTSKELDSLVSAHPRTKEDFIAFANQINEFIIQRHQSQPLYAAFVEHFVRELAMPLRDVEVRKAASGLTTLANEKQREARDKASGKKKKAATKPTLGSAKVASRVDTSAYEEVLDDFGTHADDFM